MNGAPPTQLPAERAGKKRRRASGDTLKEGTVFAERFRIERELGRGGMGVVYQAADQVLKRRVALKVIARRFADDPQFIERFQREFTAAAQLEHENIVRTYDASKTRDNDWYIVMELIDGIPLESVLRKAPKKRIDFVWAIDIASQLTNAVDAAHVKGILHRDIKPANILVGEKSRIWLVDFGLALRADASRLTDESHQMGTLRYLSPEQVLGDPLDGRTDIYQIVTVFYETVTGRSPHRTLNDPRSTQTEMMAARAHHAPEPLSRYLLDPPRRAEEIVRRGLARDPAARYPSTKELMEAWRRLMPDVAAADHPVAVRMARRHTDQTGRWLVLPSDTGEAEADEAAPSEAAEPARDLASAPAGAEAEPPAELPRGTETAPLEELPAPAKGPVWLAGAAGYRSKTGPLPSVIEDCSPEWLRHSAPPALPAPALPGTLTEPLAPLPSALVPAPEPPAEALAGTVTEPLAVALAGAMAPLPAQRSDTADGPEAKEAAESGASPPLRLADWLLEYEREAQGGAADGRALEWPPSLRQLCAFMERALESQVELLDRDDEPIDPSDPRLDEPVDPSDPSLGGDASAEQPPASAPAVAASRSLEIVAAARPVERFSALRRDASAIALGLLAGAMLIVIGSAVLAFVKRPAHPIATTPGLSAEPEPSKAPAPTAPIPASAPRAEPSGGAAPSVVPRSAPVKVPPKPVKGPQRASPPSPPKTSVPRVASGAGSRAEPPPAPPAASEPPRKSRIPSNTAPRPIPLVMPQAQHR